MAGKQHLEDDDDDFGPLPQILRQELQLKNVEEGTVFEVQPDMPAEEDSTADQAFFNSIQLMENMRLNYLVSEGSNEGSGELVDEICMPFERMAKQMEKLVPDGGVLKKVIRPGAGPTVVKDCCVTFHYNAYLEMSDEPFDSSRLRKKPQRCLLSDVMVVGLAMALTTMRKGEQCRVLVMPQYAYGYMGCPPRIPAQATILYEVELIQFLDARDAIELEGVGNDQSHLSFPELLELCKKKCSTGKGFVELKEMQRALKCYSSAISRLENARTKDAEEEKEQQALLLRLYTNAALCCDRTGRHSMAVAYAKRVLFLEPNNAKGLFRCGVGLKKQSFFDEAESYLRRALAQAPNSKHIIDELEDLNRLKKQLYDDDKTLARRMFSALGKDGSTAAANGQNSSLAVEAGVSAKMRHFIRDKLENFRTCKKGRELPFTTGFTEAHYDYVRAVCRDIGLTYEELPKGGIKVVVPM